MIVVIEGPDGTGKTTLAKTLVDKRNYRYVHNGTPPPGDLYEHYTEQILAAKGHDVVFDRLHVGELVYGPVMRGSSRITLEQMRILNRLIFAQGGKIIFCNTNIGTIVSNWEHRRQQEYVDNMGKLQNIVKGYYDIFCEMPFMYFDYEKEKPEDFLFHRYDYMNAISCPGGVWGNPKNSFLIVGERAGGDYDRAFCSMKNSSGFLNRCLWDAGFAECQLAFTNALYQNEGDPELPRNIRALWYARPEQVVITLGAVADKVCTNQGVPHLRTFHPQYVKRFKNKARQQYVKQLMRFRLGT